MRVFRGIFTIEKVHLTIHSDELGRTLTKLGEVSIVQFMYTFLVSPIRNYDV